MPPAADTAQNRFLAIISLLGRPTGATIDHSQELEIAVI
jgi:hypothetical protein